MDDHKRNLHETSYRFDNGVFSLGNHVSERYVFANEQMYMHTIHKSWRIGPDGREIIMEDGTGHRMRGN